MFCVWYGPKLWLLFKANALTGVFTLLITNALYSGTIAVASDVWNVMAHAVLSPPVAKLVLLL